MLEDRVRWCPAIVLPILAAAVVVATPWMSAFPAAQPQVSDPRANSAQTYEWPSWGGDERSSRYAGLDQINAGNFGKAEVLWRWSAANFGPMHRTSSTGPLRST